MTDDVWTVKRILEWIEGFLAQHGDPSPRVSAQWLVSEALGLSRTQLFMDRERPLTADERAVLRDWTKRRASGEPLQYITGETAFRHINVRVSRGVLIPRPETEVLVSEALALLPSAPKPQDAYDDELLRQFAEMRKDEEGQAVGRDDSAKAHVDGGGSQGGEPQPRFLVADLCTGSGCIACSMAFEHPQVHVVASDIAPEAVALARQNVELLGLGDRIQVIECDLGEGVDDSLEGSFNLVVSNPPYVPTAVLAGIPREVSEYEPALALDGGPDGLSVFRRLLEWSARALKPGGGLAVELHETCLEDAAAEADYAGFAGTRIVCDLAGKPRILTARKR